MAATTTTTKSNTFRYAKRNLRTCITLFCIISSSFYDSQHDSDVKRTFTFSKTQTYSFRVQLHKKSPTFDRCFEQRKFQAIPGCQSLPFSLGATREKTSGTQALFNLPNAVEFFGLDFYRNLQTFKMTMENLSWHDVFLQKMPHQKISRRGRTLATQIIFFQAIFFRLSLTATVFHAVSFLNIIQLIGYLNEIVVVVLDIILCLEPGNNLLT